MKTIFYGKNGVGVVLEIGEEIVFVRQWRETAKCEMLEIPGGAIEDNETPEQAGIRELAEETGYIVDKLKFVTSFYSNPGISTNKIYIFKVKSTIDHLQNNVNNAIIGVVRKHKRELSKIEFLDGKTLLALYALGYI